MWRLSFILGLALPALGSDAIAPGSCGEIAILTSLPPRIEIKCRWAGGCGNSFTLGISAGTVTSMKVSVSPEGQPSRSLASLSYAFRSAPVRVAFSREVCLSEGTLLDISYESEAQFRPEVSLPPIPR